MLEDIGYGMPRGPTVHTTGVDRCGNIDATVLQTHQPTIPLWCDKHFQMTFLKGKVIVSENRADPDPGRKYPTLGFGAGSSR